MPLSKQELLDKLDASNVQYQAFEHEGVMTVEAQVQQQYMPMSSAFVSDDHHAQAEALAALAGPSSSVGIVKNLFLKDKKARFIIISALESTKVDLKLMALRMGLAKGGLRMADPESVDEILKVPLGSVTPLAVANPEASGVTLLLDHKILSEPRVFVHPLVNTTSLSMSPEALTAALKACGRDAVFVDLEAVPKIDAENPPDLAKYLPEPPPPVPTPDPASSSAAPAAQQQEAAAPSGAKPAAKAASKQPKAAAAAGPSEATAKAAMAAKHRTLTDVAQRTDDVLQKVAQTLLGCKLEEAKVTDPYVLTRLRADIEMHLNALKNAAYTSGYQAGKGELVGFAEKMYA